jgi:hypothetical protein
MRICKFSKVTKFSDSVLVLIAVLKTTGFKLPTYMVGWFFLSVQQDEMVRIKDLMSIVRNKGLFFGEICFSICVCVLYKGVHA